MSQPGDLHSLPGRQMPRYVVFTQRGERLKSVRRVWQHSQHPVLWQGFQQIAHQRRPESQVVFPAMWFRPGSRAVPRRRWPRPQGKAPWQNPYHEGPTAGEHPRPFRIDQHQQPSPQRHDHPELGYRSPQVCPQVRAHLVGVPLGLSMLSMLRSTTSISCAPRK